jgi:hypothetical protein
MNRIILIGNGFDLAHGIRTSYQHFIDNYWGNIIPQIKASLFDRPFVNDELIILKSPGHYLKENNYIGLKEAVKNFRTNIEYKNRFLKIITEKSYIDKWVDVENEYYYLLLKSFDNSVSPARRYNVKELNADFCIFKTKLVEYLERAEKEYNDKTGNEFINSILTIGHKIFHPIDPKDLSESSLNKEVEIEYNEIKKDREASLIGDARLDSNGMRRMLFKNIGHENRLSEIKQVFLSDSAQKYFNLIPDNTLFLNFNYTFTDEIYSNPEDFNKYNLKRFPNVKTIRIHGNIAKSDNNPIIFGFGDELDEDYKLIEKLNDNDYLENIKSINYLETDNYKQLLEYINSGMYQIFIFGHSCGISDRTLLNTLFEHDNCASIKIFYHHITEQEDNYSDIVRNISRNFNDKAKMRDRVVNKNYCEKLL